MTYNLTALASSGTIYELAVYANNASNQTLVFFTVLALYFIMILALKKYDFGSAFLVSSFVCFVISIFFAYAELLSLIWVLLFLIIAAFTGMLLAMFDK
jgi:hypothetical protein